MGTSALLVPNFMLHFEECRNKQSRVKVAQAIRGLPIIVTVGDSLIMLLAVQLLEREKKGSLFIIIVFIRETKRYFSKVNR